VTYSNDAKRDMLGVDPALIQQQGAVSEAVARAMALGALQRARVQLAVGVTGIAGPGGATPGKPVGTVWLALAQLDGAQVRLSAERLQLHGTRAEVRERTVLLALQRLRARA
jgi:nicotinamide-nucleotide amidase